MDLGPSGPTAHAYLALHNREKHYWLTYGFRAYGLAETRGYGYTSEFGISPTW